MQAYMKSEMPFLGIQAAPRRKICHAVFKRHPLEEAAAWIDATLTLWREAEYREERYAALDLIGYARYRRFQSPSCMPMYEEMIAAGAWWDFVDELAVRHVGALLDDYSREIEPIMRAWSIDEDLWKRRTAIICQVLRKNRTDEVLLSDCIEPSIDRKEFFLRKAIGWALRAQSLVDPAFVRSYVDANAERLSPLSVKEALRRISDK